MTDDDEIDPGAATPDERAREAYRVLDLLSSGYTPHESDLAGAPFIENWVMIHVGNGVVVLIGDVTGHPILKSYKPKMTSALLAIDEDAGWARTYSRYYRLGPRRRRE
jgi:hypothetical protein